MFNRYFTRGEEKKKAGVDIEAFLYAPLKAPKEPAEAKSGAVPAKPPGKVSIKDHSGPRTYLDAKGKRLDYYYECSPGAEEAGYVASAIDNTRFVARTIMAGLYDEKQKSNNYQVKKRKISAEELAQALLAKEELDKLREKRNNATGRSRKFLDKYIQKAYYHGGRVADAYNKARRRQDRLKSQQIAGLETVKKAVLDVGALRLGGAAGVYEIWPDAFQDVDLHIGSVHIHPKDWALMASALWIVGTTVLADRWRARKEERNARDEERIWNDAGNTVTGIYENVTDQTAEIWWNIFGSPSEEHTQKKHGFIPLRPQSNGNGSYA